MNYQSAFLAIRWLVRDTFRQAVASRVSWLMMAVSAIAIFFCLGVSISGTSAIIPGAGGDDVKGFVLPEHEWEKYKKAQPFLAQGEGTGALTGSMSLLFGTVAIPLSGSTPIQAVRHIQLLLAGAVADTFGIFLTIIWTAAFLPTFLEPANATVLLAKPIPRWSLLAGKFIGVLLFVLVQATIFVFGTWLALAFRTHVWDALYLFCIPMLLLHFAIFFSFSTFLAVWTRSTVVCIFGSIVFWLLCWGMNYGHHAWTALQLQGPPRHLRQADLFFLTTNPQAPVVPGALPWAGLATEHHRNATMAPPLPTSVSRVPMEIAYWILPKPADISNLLFHALNAKNYFSQLAEYEVLREKGAFHPEWAVLSSIVFMIVILGISGYEFVHTDY